MLSRIAPALPIILMFLCIAASAEDTITLKDGKTITGTITQQDAETVYIQQKDGDARGIARSRIEKIDHGATGSGTGSPFKPGGTPITVEEKKTPGTPGGTVKEISFDAAFLRELKDLGAPQLEKRKAIFEKIVQMDQAVVTILLAMLDPRQDTDEFTRVGICRALCDMGPVSEQAAQTLAYCAARDRYTEARREACRSIRDLQDDRAIRQLLKYASSTDVNLRKGAAAALREIDDGRVLESLIRSIPQPEVNANMGELKNTDPNFLPIGPGGAKLPIFLPKQEVSGTAGNIESPAADLLKLIAGKDLGNLPIAWLNWYREKCGDVTRSDLDSTRVRRAVGGVRK